MRLAFLYILAIFALPLLSVPAHSHGNLHEQIAKISKQIKAHPDSALLYFKRGQLHHQHGDLQLSLKDLKKTRKLQPDFSEVNYDLAEVLADMSKPKKALSSIQKFITDYPQSMKAYLNRARIYTMFGKHSLATSDYQVAIKLSVQPLPEYYLLLSESLIQGKVADHQAAIKCLQDGKKRLGFIITLQNRMIDIELLRQQYTSALSLIDETLAQLNRKEKWLVKKAEVLAQAGKIQEAIQTYNIALREIKQLPQRHKNAPHTKELLTDIHQSLKQLQ